MKKLYLLRKLFLQKANEFYCYAYNLNLKKRRIFLILVDLIIVSFCYYFTFIFNKDFKFEQYKEFILYIFIVLPLIYFLTGQYKGITRYSGSINFYILAFRNLLGLSLIKFLLFSFNNLVIPINYFFIFWVQLTFFIGISRMFLRDILLIVKNPNITPSKVIIYGAGSAGAQLAASSRIGRDYSIIAYIDDSSDLWNRYLYGIKIYPPSSIKHFKDDLDYVLLSIPSLKEFRKRQIIKSLQDQDIKVLQIPSIQDLKSGRSKIDKLKPISINDLLPRKIVKPDLNLISPRLFNSVVCVTGGAGSIGSELCRQILKSNPKKLIIIDHSEPSLYNIDQELKLNNNNVDIYPILGNAADMHFIREIFINNKVEIVFHAAAYKHVPLVEVNPMAGIKNNILSSLNVCKAANYSKYCSHAILISSDKAVRPTNIMGASKRFSELIFQAFAENVKASNRKSEINKTLFSMVRFGNVLASSGSVVPLFMNQIDKGGPITLTHKDITRFFMTITEAAHLVMQSVALSKGGDVFLLDMGEPVKIINLAKQLIKLAGLTLKDKNNPNGDIEIVYTGLRKGEKLFEELLLDGIYHKTKHPKIFMAEEAFIKYEELIPKIERLENNINSGNLDKVFEILSEVVPEWAMIKK